MAVPILPVALGLGLLAALLGRKKDGASTTPAGGVVPGGVPGVSPGVIPAGTIVPMPMPQPRAPITKPGATWQGYTPPAGASPTTIESANKAGWAAWTEAKKAGKSDAEAEAAADAAAGAVYAYAWLPGSALNPATWTYGEKKQTASQKAAEIAEWLRPASAAERAAAPTTSQASAWEGKGGSASVASPQRTALTRLVEQARGDAKPISSTWENVKGGGKPGYAPKKGLLEQSKDAWKRVVLDRISDKGKASMPAGTTPKDMTLQDQMAAAMAKAGVSGADSDIGVCIMQAGKKFGLARELVSRAADRAMTEYRNALKLGVGHVTAEKTAYEVAATLMGQ